MERSDIVEKILLYFDCVEESLHELALHEEGYLSELPLWATAKKLIQLGITLNNDGLVLKVIPESSRDKTAVEIKQISRLEEANQILRPMTINVMPQEINNALFCSDMKVMSDNPIALPILVNAFGYQIL